MPKSPCPTDAGDTTSVTSPAPAAQLPNRVSPSYRPKLRSSCDSCQDAKVKCSQTKPSCNRCLQHGIKCLYSPLKRIGRPPKLAAAAAAKVAAEPASLASSTAIECDNIPAETMTAFGQTDMMQWSFNTMEVDLRYPTPLSLSRTQSEANSGQISVDWGGQSSGKSGDAFPNSFQQGHIDGLGSLEKHFKDADVLLPSPYTTRSSLFDPMQDFSSQGDMQMSPAMSDIASTLQFKPMGTEVADLNDPLNLFFYQSDFTAISGDTSGTEQSVDRPASLSVQDGDIFRGLLKSDTTTSSSQTTPTADPSNDFPSDDITNLPPLFPVSTELCAAGCCLALMKSLFQLSSGLTVASKPPSLDIVLSMDRETHSNKERVLACKSCLGKNRSSILLLTMVMERLVQVLERRDKVVTTMKNITGRNERNCSVAVMPTKRRQSPRDMYSSPQANPLLETECPLLIKNFEVDEDTKRRFLKGLWKVQLRGLLSMLKEIEQAVRVDLNDINYRLAKEMTVDVRRRLESLTGQLEIGD
ncbi:hypothetical protein O988_03521 [Pseudogymnoascus sp. VKM F-3808]|nr:hypothetical protein O988_03521 [Pseudogymnoascus sp. VKM F-3808]